MIHEHALFNPRDIVDIVSRYHRHMKEDFIREV